MSDRALVHSMEDVLLADMVYCAEPTLKLVPRETALASGASTDSYTSGS